MKYLQENIEKKLSFDQIRELVKGECIGQVGRNVSERMSFLTSHKSILLYLKQTEEFRQVLISESDFPTLEYYDSISELERVRMEGTRIEIEVLFDLKSSLRTVLNYLTFFLKKAEDKYPLLTKLSERLVMDSSIVSYIDKLIDDKGEILDSASEELFQIRREQRRKISSIDKQIAKVFNLAKKEGWVPENSEVTIRNGRMVIPLIDSHRRKIKGFIHDESATRQTAFLEPSEVVELNNDLRELEFAERREIDKILLAFTDYIRPSIDNLIDAHRYLGNLDFIRAKAKFALKISAVLPLVFDKPIANWIEAKHPILYLSLQKQNKEVIPLTIKLTSEKRILIISGPNAGGKSVCLKTLGLLQYMLQCGLLVPVKESSEFGLFDQLFIEIGDEQSIENDLSTYSSHLVNMKNLLKTAGDKTLFLIDEFGAGTEPKIGGAIAEAVLHKLDKEKAFGVITTHYSNLKLMADRHPEIENAAMLFDTEQMRPLYQLVIGKPGSSFAFEIAKKIGLPQEVLDEVVKNSGEDILNFEKQLHQIEVDKIEIEKKKTELQVADEFFSEVIEKYTKLNDQLSAKRTEIISEARKEAKQLIKEANQRIENTISEIKKTQAEKQETQIVRKKLNAFAEEIEQQEVKELQKKQEKKPQKVSTADQWEYDNSELKVGDIVAIENQSSFGEVSAIKGKKIEVISNSVKLTIDRDKLRKTNKQKLPATVKKSSETRYSSVLSSINELRATFSPKIDLRGKRAEESIDILQKYLDDAQLLGEKELRILHGKGNGILKTMIREYLRSHSEVRTFYAEHVENGGEGITIAILR